jgi:hypothetical protein
MTEPAAFVLRWGDEASLDAVPAQVESIVLHRGRDERWLLLDSPERFGEWADAVASRISARTWTTIAGLNDWPVDAYAGHLRTLATGRLLRSLDHQLAGHVLAMRAILAADREADVRVGLVHRSPYELEGLLRDVLDVAAAGVPRGEVGSHLRRRRDAHERAHPARTPKQRLRRRLVASAVPLELALPRSIGAVYAAAEVGVR